MDSRSFKTALLIQKARNGDSDSFVELMEQNKLSMYKTALSILNNEEDTADAMQEAYLSCFLNISKLEKINYFKTWLIRIVINKSYDILRGRRTHIDLDEIAELIPNIDDDILRVDELSDSILNDIDENYSLILSLHYASGYSIKEISKITSLGENTIKTRLSRGREKLKIAVDERRNNNG